MLLYDDGIQRVELELHTYSEKSARAAVERRRAKGEEAAMRHINGVWYVGRVVNP
jgi:hypothetical protein